MGIPNIEMEGTIEGKLLKITVQKYDNLRYGVWQMQCRGKVGEAKNKVEIFIIEYVLAKVDYKHSDIRQHCY